jgi:hypothetical protein
MSSGFFQLLLLIIIANGAPIVVRQLLNNSFDLAVDFGQQMPDQQRIFGTSKTWRGIISALLFTSVAAWLMRYTPETGLLVAVYAVSGDLFSSFIKRRLSLPPSSMAPLLDQVPESLFPAFMLMDVFKLDISTVFMLVLTFIMLELLLSHTLYKWGMRKKPY